MGVKQFKSFLESVKSYNPTLVNAIMEGFDSLFEELKPATRGDAEKLANTPVKPTTPVAPAKTVSDIKTDFYKGLDKKTTELGKLNNLNNPNIIQIGQKIKLANGSEYTVVKGDTLSGIAHGKTKVQEIATPTAQPTQPVQSQKNSAEQTAMNVPTNATVTPSDPYANTTTVDQKKTKFIADWVKSGKTEQEALAKWNELAISKNKQPVQQTKVTPVQQPAPKVAPVQEVKPVQQVKVAPQVPQAKPVQQTQAQPQLASKTVSAPVPAGQNPYSAQDAEQMALNGYTPEQVANTNEMFRKNAQKTVKV